MKAEISYVCDYCDFHSDKFAEVQAHEAEHLGMAVEEYQECLFLKRAVGKPMEQRDTDSDIISGNEMAMGNMVLDLFMKKHLEEGNNRLTAKWLPKDGFRCICSNCGHWEEEGRAVMRGSMSLDYAAASYKYCPACGAKMTV